MPAGRRSLIVPLLMIAPGTGWLLTAAGYAPDINWVWTICLAAAGLLTFVAGGFDKFTLVIGPLLLIMSCLSVLRQAGRISLDIEVPLLVIITGVLLLIVRSPAVPAPEWLLKDIQPPEKRG
jgi:hypothetical protein